MAVKTKVKSGDYYDSVTLMSIARDIKEMEGINEIVLVMGTKANKGIVEDAGLLSAEVKEANPDDLVIVVEGEEKILSKALDKAEELLVEKRTSSREERERRPRSLEGAISRQPDSNLVLISVPGEFAAREARKALKKDLHVMLFSDNVELEKERELKEMAREKGLLMMGADCGTAIINQVPLAFANVIEPGPVGIIAASGTGAQEVSTLIQRQGVGLSQVIGTGGRDLKKEIGGLEMIKDLKALAADDETEVIVLVSKPPAREVSEKIMQEVEKLDIPVVVNFLGGDPEVISGDDVFWAATLEEAAEKAVELAPERADMLIPPSGDELQKMAREETNNMSDKQRYVRGLYTGGTLCSEALLLLQEEMGPVYSNVALDEDYALGSDLESIEDTVIDLGEDEFTRGSPHPMIEPGLRNDRLAEESEDEEAAVILLDVVLGYGSHEDPAGKLAEAVREAKEKASERGGYLAVIASVCGTDGDPQNREEQVQKLEEAGVRVFDTNAQAVKAAAAVLNEIRGK